MRGPIVALSAAQMPTRWVSVKKVSVHEEMNPSFRASMEDTWAARDEFCDEPQWGFFAVYDGHGGREVAEYLKDNLADLLAKEIGEHEESGDRTMEQCLVSAFHITDMRAKATYGASAAGSTACVCVVKTKGTSKFVYTANCGDARAVLCTGDGSAKRLSLDHKATDEAEVKRIEDLGGFVVRGRVLGVLAVARAFGDFSLKKYVPCTPYTSEAKLESTAKFLIIACDGVWDVISDDEAVGLVREFCDGAAAKGTRAAKHLVEQAIARGSTDNVTCLVVFL